MSNDTKWRKFPVNIQNICAETDTGICIQMPHKSDHDGFTFWVSKKLIRKGCHSYEIRISVCEDMGFTLKKMGQGKYNFKKVIAEKPISANNLADAFGGYID